MLIRALDPSKRHASLPVAAAVLRPHDQAGELDRASQIVVGSGAVADVVTHWLERVRLVRRHRDATAGCPTRRHGAGAARPGVVREAGALGAEDLDGERVALTKPGLDHADRAVRVPDRHDGVVLDRTSGERGVGGADRAGTAPRNSCIR